MGTYALVLRSDVSAATEIGRWGRLTIRPGYYVYVGSALGPGGVRARVSRHCRETKKNIGILIICGSSRVLRQFGIAIRPFVWSTAGRRHWQN